MNLATPVAVRAARICLAVALVTRLGVIAYATVDPARFDYPDAQRYAHVARNIAAGNGPIDSPAVRCGTDPLWPLLLSPAPALGADSGEALFLWGRIINLLLGLWVVHGVMQLAARFAGPAAALPAGLFAALDPIFVFFHGLVLTEIVFTALLLAAGLALLRTLDTDRPRDAASAGLLLGLATLARSSALPLVAVWGGLILLCANKPRRVARAGLFAVAFALPLLPTTIRNYRLLGAWVPVRTGLGATLLDGLGDWADGGTGMERIFYPEYPPGATEYDRERANRAAALHWVRQNPARTARLAIAKLRRFWAVTLSAPGYQGNPWDIVCLLTVVPVYLLAAAGVWLARRRRTPLLLLIATMLYFTLLHALFIGSVRYRVPLLPGLFALAGVTIAAMTRPAAANQPTIAHESA